MRSVSKVTLIGNVGTAEVKTTGSGTKFAKVTLATNRTFKDRNGQKVETVEWHRLTFWERLAELVEEYVGKGDRLYVEGRIEYTTSGEGEDRKYFTDIVVQEMVMLGGSGERPAMQSASIPAASKSPFDSDDDALPF